MYIRWVVVGTSSSGLVLERYFLRRWHRVCMVRNDLLEDPCIRRVVVIRLCWRCGNEMRDARCLNTACENSVRVALAVPEQETAVV